MDLSDALNHVWGLVGLADKVPQVVAVASVVCALTPTPNPDSFIGRVYKLVEIMACNIGKAKDK